MTPPQVGGDGHAAIAGTADNPFGLAVPGLLTLPDLFSQDPDLLTGAFAESLPLRAASNDNAGELTSQQPYLFTMPFHAGQVLTSMTFVAGATGAGTPTNQWAFICDTSRTVLAVSGDLLATAWASRGTQVFTFAPTFRFPWTGVYYAGIMVKATTVPTLYGQYGNVNTALLTLAPIPDGTSSTGALTTPSAVGTQFGALTAGAPGKAWCSFA